WFINKCQAENSWIAVWKVADAVTNPNFSGTTMNVTYGTYTEIGGTGGYGGGDNGWYTHWAGYVPYANGGDGNGNCDPGRGGNCKDFGTLWNDAYNALMAAPDNDISQAGWYVLMTNLHETGWHDALGGDISGWQLQYSSHIKNAMMYAEAAHWANGEYTTTTAAYFSDIDNDGYDELVMHNDRVFAVFEGIGGRATNIFAKGIDYNYSVIGVDNAYWAGTTADYNDVNHIAALSDVGPNYQHSGYGIDIVQGTGSTVIVDFTHEGLTKTVKLTTGQPYLDVIYDTGGGTQYIKTGYSPGLVDLVWNAQMDRVWVSDVAYYGQRNPNNGATAAIISGSAGANHNFEFSGRIMKGDEIYGSDVFEFLLYAGKTSAPDMSGDISELRALASLADTIGPDVSWAVYYPGSDKLRIRFDQVVQHALFSPPGVRIDDDDDGIPELSIDISTAIIETADGYEMTLQLVPADAAVLEGLDTGSLELLMLAGSALDLQSNGNRTITNTDDKAISYGEATMITIDGYIDTAEWEECLMAVDDSLDSGWTAANEIDALYVTWDSVYLYLALDGIVSGNSWLIYLDVDPGTANGETDLTGIDAWERGASFTASGFACDFEYGCYQHQGQYDTDGFFRIDSSTHAEDISDSVITAFDSQHDYGDAGGSELAIPWDVLYGLGTGAVPAGASLSIVASVCWDPEPDGELGGDSAPSNLTASLPTIDRVYTFVVDADGNGIPDDSDEEGPALESCHRDVSGDDLVNVVFSEQVEEGSAENTANYNVFWTTIPSNTVGVLSAELQPDGVTVQLALAAPIGYGYSLSVTGVTDASCYRNAIIPLSEILIGGPPTGDDDRVVRYGGGLEQNYPNPFNPVTTIRFEVPGSAGSGSKGVVPVNISVYDVRGALVRVLVDSAMEPGPAATVWDGKNRNGTEVSSGIYFYRIVSGEWCRTRKMVLLR
ncbi:MAG TPA: hypothetical protein VLA34_02395, partial [Candidatus Krumholzibacterium sp.]|nr:hypothetical protein [Candidatus Krumholzibacterium sp.]